MLESKIEAIKKEKNIIEKQLASPAIISNPEKFKLLSVKYKEIENILNLYKKLKDIEKETSEIQELIRKEKDIKFKEALKREKEDLEEQRKKISEELLELMTPKDERWYKNCIVEIRAAAGGDEASLFTADLFRMYIKYAEKRNWKYEILSTFPTEVGGYREIIFLIKNHQPYKYMQFEAGIHRVQRIPITEASGRIHTSTATVAVLPETEEKEIKINPKDLKIEVFRASGHGGQHVNVTDSAVRITHIPTGIVVCCQDERSQHQNRARALKILYARLKEKQCQEEEKKLKQERKEQVKTGKRSEKIRTYNIPQNRVTEHRISKSIYRLQEVMDGDLFEIHEALLEKEIKKYV